MDAPASAPRPIGRLIKRAREKRRWSQGHAASLLGVSRSALNAWENDRAYPRSSIGALEELYGISLDEDADPPPALLDERLGREDADIIRNLLRDMEPERADAILAGLEERLRRRASGHG